MRYNEEKLRNIIDELGKNKLKNTTLEATKKFKDFFRSLEKIHKYENFSNELEVGRFYTFKYIPKNLSRLTFWDKMPIVLCLSNNFKLRIGDNLGKNFGFIGVNLHYYSSSERSEFIKKLILDDNINKYNFMNDRNLSIKGKIFDSQKGLQQYYRGGMYLDSNDKRTTFGAFNVMQVPYKYFYEMMFLPSVYEIRK